MDEGIIDRIFRIWEGIKFRHCLFFGLFVFCTSTRLWGQELNELKNLYHQQELRQAYIAAGLINVKQAIPDVAVSLAYASDTNVFGVDFYGGLNEAYLVKEGIEKLTLANEFLQTQRPDLTLLILDAARPRSVQRQMWNAVQGTGQESYVAFPEGSGSLHNLGCAIDLTLVDSSGKLLNMGYGYDHFGPEAEPGQHEELLMQGLLTEEQVENRLLLRRSMQAGGFQVINREWWHFNVFPKDLARTLYPLIE